MCPDSPNVHSSSIVNIVITSNGSAISDSYNLMDIKIHKKLNRIPYATIVFNDGNMATGDFKISDSDVLKPGAKIEIKVGYGSSSHSLFKGVVVKQSMHITSEIGAQLEVECKDPAVQMTVARVNANFLKKKDSAIMTSIIGTYSDLSNAITATTAEHDELVQYYCSDWDFLLSRADANGYVVSVEDGKLTIGPPKSAAAVLKVTYGLDLISFDADVDAQSQLKKVKSVAWDPKKQAIVESTGEKTTLPDQGNLTSSTLSDVLKCSEYVLRSSGVKNSNEIKSWASGQLLRAELARITGSMTFQGSEKALPNTVITVDGVGKRFNGDVYATGVIHEIRDGDWLTTVEFGLSPEFHTEKSDVSASGASGYVPAINGLYVGKVKKIDADPESEYRIQVTIPVLQMEEDGVWARLGTFWGSSDYGAFFIPDVDDEVIVGYFNDDPSHPVVLGSLYSSKQKPANEITSDNDIKGIVSKSKIKVEFNDKDKVLTLETPGGNKVTFSDKEKSIVVEDQNSNKVSLESGGITLDSPKDINIKSKGKIVLDSVGGIEASSKGDLALKGMNVNATANVGFVAKGNATAEVSASGQTTLKGAMVMIN